MTMPARRERPMFAELVDWLEGEFPGSPLMRPFAGMQVMRVEDYIEEGRYVLRAEVPGIDPDKDVEISVSGGMLRINAERRVEEETEKKGYTRHEMRYGSFTRTLPLAEGAAEDDIKADYKDGVLEIRVPVGQPEVQAEPKKIAVSHG